MAKTEIPQKTVDEILAMCGRRCCICCRFRPLHLIIHHIKEQGEGGTHEPDNLIPICVSCHADVHTESKLTRRFTERELKQHRDHLFQLVADGKLTAEADDSGLATLSASIVQRLMAIPFAPQAPAPQLCAHAVEILLAAVNANAPINAQQYDGGLRFGVGGECFPPEAYDLRAEADYEDGINELITADLVRWRGPQLFVTRRGWIIADDILSAGSEAAPQ